MLLQSAVRDTQMFAFATCFRAANLSIITSSRIGATSRPRAALFDAAVRVG